MFNGAHRKTDQESGRRMTYVAEAYRKGHTFASLPYQQNGMRSATLWTTMPQCLRIIPGYNTDTGEIYRQIIPGVEYCKDYTPADYLTETFAVVRTISRLGIAHHAVITSYKPDSPDYIRWGGNTVISWFASDITKSVNAKDNGRRPKLPVHPIWHKWVTYDKNTKTPAILSYDRETLFMQALVYTLNGQPNTDINKNPLVDPNTGAPLPKMYLIGLDNTQSMQELYKALIEPKDPTKPLDGLDNNIYRGIAEQNGTLLYMLPNSVTRDKKKYNVLIPHVSQDTRNWNYTEYPLSDELIKELWVPWDKVFNYMTAAEQCKLLAQEFGADTVNYVIKNNAILRDLEIPEDIARVGIGRYASIDGGSVTLQSGGVAAPHTAAPAAPVAPAPFIPPSMTPKSASGSIPPVIPNPGITTAPAPTTADTQPTARSVFVAPPIDKNEFAQELLNMSAGENTRIDNIRSMAQDLAGDIDASDYSDPFDLGGN